jgi:hypothetical protein
MLVKQCEIRWEYDIDIHIHIDIGIFHGMASRLCHDRFCDTDRHAVEIFL